MVWLGAGFAVVHEASGTALSSERLHVTSRVCWMVSPHMFDDPFHLPTSHA